MLSRTLAVVVLGIALLGIYRLIFAPLVIACRDGETSIEQSKELLQRYEALAEQQERAASPTGYLTGPSDALAAAQPQDRVKSAVEAAGGELRSTQILAATRLELSMPLAPQVTAALPAAPLPESLTLSILLQGGRSRRSLRAPCSRNHGPRAPLWPARR